VIPTTPSATIDHGERLNRVRAEMARHGVDYLLIGPSTDMVYMLGYPARQSERLTLLMIGREGKPHLVMPSFELARVQHLTGTLELNPWTEAEDPNRLVASLVPGDGDGVTIAVGGQLYTYFLLRLQEVMPRARFVSGDLVMEPVRMRKSVAEVERLRAAGRAADAVWEEFISLPMVGVSEKEMLAHLHRLLIEKGHDAIGGGIVGIGPNGASPHHHVSDRRAATGDAVVVDFGGTRQDYRSDITRTFHVGPPTQEFRRVYEIVNEANQLASQAARPGMRAEELDRVARDHIARAGYAEAFLHRLGHGIGLDGHEGPYLVRGSEVVLDEGMTFSIEPGIYLEGRFGVRIEDIVVLTGRGAERLNMSSHELMVVG